MLLSTYLPPPPSPLPLPSPSPAHEFGLFKPDEDPTKGRWLEQGRTLEYYHLKSGVRGEEGERGGREERERGGRGRGEGREGEGEGRERVERLYQ